MLAPLLKKKKNYTYFCYEQHVNYAHFSHKTTLKVCFHLDIIMLWFLMYGIQGVCIDITKTFKLMIMYYPHYVPYYWDATDPNSYPPKSLNQEKKIISMIMSKTSHGAYRYRLYNPANINS